MLGLVLSVLALQLLVVYVPFLDQFFNVTPLPLPELLLALALGSVVYLVMEVRKWRAGP
jgi:Ca2+-transporting ATPase